MIQIKDVLHYYIGQKCIRSSHWEPQNEPYVLTGASLAEAIEFGDGPILRRLCDMTQEEALKVCQMKSEVYTDIDDVELSGQGFYFTHRYGIRARRFKRWFSINDLNAQQFHYLLKQGFDLFNLIDNGFAIDAKTIQP